MTISLEQLADGSVSDRNFQKLMRLVLDTGGQSVGIRFSTGTVTFTASTVSAGTVVAHGLGRTPVVVLLQELNGFVRLLPSALGTANFTATGYVTNNVNANGAFGFQWVAIG